VTTRGFKEEECEKLANWMCDILDDLHNQAEVLRIQKQVIEICGKFPVYRNES